MNPLVPDLAIVPRLLTKSDLVTEELIESSVIAYRRD